MSVPVVLLAVLLTGSPQQAATPPEPESTPQTSSSEKPSQSTESTTTELPVSLKRIQRALSAPSPLRLVETRTRDGRQIFRVDIEGEKIDIQELIGRDSLRAPATYGGMTHQEFLDLVTPDDVKGYAAFSNGQGMVVAATSIALQWAALKAIDKFKEAKDSRAKEAARKEVEEALEARRRARRAAGLPDK